MYKIMLADDEGIVLKSLKLIIEKNFGQSCEIATAKTGRGVIELADSFRPDIAIIDIQMPGINGIDAIEEVKKSNKHTYFIIMTAYDKFDYAKKAIDLGVIEFLTKPFNAEKMTKVLEKTMGMVEEDRQKWQADLKNKEKLETVVPIIESGMIYTILFQEDYSEQSKSFRQLLEIEEDYGFMMVIEFGEQRQEDAPSRKASHMSNPVGATVKVQRFYKELCEIVKEFFKCYVGSSMANKVIAFMPCLRPEIEYNERIMIISRARDMVDKLRKRIDVDFQVGIGSIQPIEQLLVSYKEAVRAMKMVPGTVAHIKDILPCQNTTSHLFFDMEKQLFIELKKGDLPAFIADINNLYDFLWENYGEDEAKFRLKLFETLVVMQKEVREYIRVDLNMDDGQLSDILSCKKEQIKRSFTEYMSWLYEYHEGIQNEVYSDIVVKAKKLIDSCFDKDINLDYISRKVNISPYYFSKLFKEETGENFIDYITRIRIEKAKEGLKQGERSIKEVCIQVGYKDPNYFSRLFKKQVGVTPTEYREGL